MYLPSILLMTTRAWMIKMRKHLHKLTLKYLKSHMILTKIHHKSSSSSQNTNYINIWFSTHVHITHNNTQNQFQTKQKKNRISHLSENLWYQHYYIYIVIHITVNLTTYLYSLYHVYYVYRKLYSKSTHKLTNIQVNISL